MPKQVQKSLLATVLALLMISLADADSQIQVYDDVIGTINQQNLNVLKRVVKTVNVDYNYQLVADSQFHRFPDMDISIYLKYPQFVTIIYNIGVAQPRVAYIETRVLINGVEEQLMHRMADYTASPSVFAHVPVWMQKGNNKIQVEYRTHTNIHNTNYPWKVAILRVDYSQP